MKMYTAAFCPDCQRAKRILAERQLPYVAVDILASTTNMKEFLALRDDRSAFNSIKKERRIGIPCFLFTDGTLSFAVDELDEQRVQADREAGSCPHALEDEGEESSSAPMTCGLDGC